MTQHSDDTIRRAVEASAGFEEAAARLGMSKTWTRKQADRLSVRTQFRYGVERLPSDTELRTMLRDAGRGRGATALARRLGVTKALLLEEADDLGVDPRYQVRAGLPDDETLRRDLTTCASIAEVARRYGVHVHTMRNQLRRLGIPAPSRRSAAVEEC